MHHNIPTLLLFNLIFKILMENLIIQQKSKAIKYKYMHECHQSLCQLNKTLDRLNSIDQLFNNE